MEIGAVIGAAPAENVVPGRARCPGIVVILLGGRTGRDGCGGATGSSKAHTCRVPRDLRRGGAKGQRARRSASSSGCSATRRPPGMIKRCNDFGAGGVSVAIGELADGLEIDLDAVPKKYEGLDGTELAISESQERMAVVVAPEDAEQFLLAGAEGKSGGHAWWPRVTESPRLVMHWNGKTIVDLSREFLNSNGAEKHITCHAASPQALLNSKFPARPSGAAWRRWREI